MMRDRPIGPADATPTSTMDRHHLAAWIRRDGIWTVVAPFVNVAARVVLGLRDAVNIAGWETGPPTPGIVYFRRYVDVADPTPRDPDEMVIYLNTADRERIAALMTLELPCPVAWVTKAELRVPEPTNAEKLAWMTLHGGPGMVRRFAPLLHAREDA